MQERHSKVNFRKLVRELADMYRDDTFDVVLSELVANALDAKPSRILIDWDRGRRVLTVADDGNGMDATAFEQYHDFAAELKTRGDSIGFAGIGAKISFNIADQVITETRRSGVVNSSDWRWHPDGSLRWNRIESDRLQADGTRVEVHFGPDEDLHSVDDKYLLDVLWRQYLPLFVSAFLSTYQSIGMYRSRPQFIVNGVSTPVQDLNTLAALTQTKNLDLRVGTQPIGWGAVGVSERDRPIGDRAYGVLLCTHGKVIKPELFGLSTGSLGAKLFGIVEIPDLVRYLTTNKADLKGGPGRLSGLNRLLDPVREELRTFLEQQGITTPEQRRNQLTTRLERELIRMVGNLPELQDFDGLLRRSRRLRKSRHGLILTSPNRQSPGNGTAPEAANGAGASGGSSSKPDPDGKTPTRRQRSRNNHGPRVAFEEHPNRSETAWLDSNTVVINSGHTAYRQRINQDQARLTYCMFAIGVALDKSDVVESTDGVSYVDKFIAAWGQS